METVDPAIVRAPSLSCRFCAVVKPCIVRSCNLEVCKQWEKSEGVPELRVGREDVIEEVKASMTAASAAAVTAAAAATLATPTLADSSITSEKT